MNTRAGDYSQASVFIGSGFRRNDVSATLFRVGGGGVLLGGLLGAEDVASVGSGGHRLPGAGGAQAAVTDIVERGLVGVGASLGGAGGIEIMLC